MFVVRRERDRWWAERYDSEKGHVFMHRLGPFAWSDRTWLDKDGMIRTWEWSSNARRQGEPFQTVRNLVLERWDDFREVALKTKKEPS